MSDVTLCRHIQASKKRFFPTLLGGQSVPLGFTPIQTNGLSYISQAPPANGAVQNGVPGQLRAACLKVTAVTAVGCGKTCCNVYSMFTYYFTAVGCGRLVATSTQCSGTTLQQWAVVRLVATSTQCSGTTFNPSMHEKEIQQHSSKRAAPSPFRWARGRLTSAQKP